MIPSPRFLTAGLAVVVAHLASNLAPRAFSIESHPREHGERSAVPSPPESTPPAAPRAPEQKAAEAALKAGVVLDANNLAESERVLIEADRTSPNQSAILHLLSLVQQRLGKSGEAVATAERLIRYGEPFVDESYLVASQVLTDLRMQKEGERMLAGWAVGRPITANYHAAIGILRFGAGDQEGAERELRRAIDADPVNEPALKALFQAHGRRGEYGAFQPLLDTALEIRPRSVGLLMLSGTCFMRQKRYQDARSRFEAITKLDPGNPDGWVNLGAASGSLGETEVAFAQFRKAIETDGKNVDAPLNLAMTLERAGRLAESREVLVAARSRGIEDQELLRALARAHYLGREYDDALAVAGESLGRNPRQPLLRELVERIERERSAPPVPDPAAASSAP